VYNAFCACTPCPALCAVISHAHCTYSISGCFSYTQTKACVATYYVAAYNGYVRHHDDVEDVNSRFVVAIRLDGLVEMLTLLLYSITVVMASYELFFTPVTVTNSVTVPGFVCMTAMGKFRSKPKLQPAKTVRTDEKGESTNPWTPSAATPPRSRRNPTSTSTSQVR